MAESHIFQISVKVDVEKGSDDFKKARREINKLTKEAVGRAVDRVVMPRVKMNAARFHIQGTPVAPLITYKPVLKRGGYITWNRRNKAQGNAIGWLEFGGVNDSMFKAKNGKALNTPFGPKTVVYRGQGGNVGSIKSFATGVGSSLTGARIKKRGKTKAASLEGFHFITKARNSSTRLVEAEMRQEVEQAFARLFETGELDIS